MTDLPATRDATANTYRFTTAGVLAAFSASLCCLGPFALMATGISGAWMSRLMGVERYQPVLIVLSVSFFALAGWKLFSASERKNTAGSCPIPRAKRQQKLIFFLAGCLALILLTSEFWIVWLAG